MSGLDLILLIFYGASVCSVAYRAIYSLFVDEVKVEWDKEDLQEQLAAQKLKDKIKIKFKLEDRYEYDRLHNLEISIENKSDRDIYIDWEQSRLIDDEKRSQRVVRIISGMPFDLLPAQVQSVIPPEKKLKEKLTVESTLKRNPETGPLKTEASLVKLSKFKPDPKKDPPKPPPETIDFSLRLVLGLAEAVRSDRQISLFDLDCKFTARQLSWQDAIPRPERRK